MGTSGLRPNEARQLRWRDVGSIIDENGTEQVLLHISPTTKTGARECVPLRSAKRYLDQIKTISKFTNDDDLVFCNQDGEWVSQTGDAYCVEANACYEEIIACSTGYAAVSSNDSVTATCSDSSSYWNTCINSCTSKDSVRCKPTECHIPTFPLGLPHANR